MEAHGLLTGRHGAPSHDGAVPQLWRQRLVPGAAAKARQPVRPKLHARRQLVHNLLRRLPALLHLRRRAGRRRHAAGRQACGRQHRGPAASTRGICRGGATAQDRRSLAAARLLACRAVGLPSCWPARLLERPPARPPARQARPRAPAAAAPPAARSRRGPPRTARRCAGCRRTAARTAHTPLRCMDGDAEAEWEGGRAVARQGRAGRSKDVRASRRSAVQGQAAQAPLQRAASYRPAVSSRGGTGGWQPVACPPALRRSRLSASHCGYRAPMSCGRATHQGHPSRHVSGHAANPSWARSNSSADGSRSSNSSAGSSSSSSSSSSAGSSNAGSSSSAGSGSSSSSPPSGAAPSWAGTARPCSAAAA